MEEKIAIISDIHGNKEALQAVLYDISSRKVDRIFNLGDSLYGPLDPAGTVQILMEYKMAHIMGNCDRLLFEPSENPTVNFVKNRLTRDQLNWLKQHPATVVFDDLLLCHGTPESDEVYLLEEMTEEGKTLKSLLDIETSLKDVKQNVIICGHTHIPRVVYLANGKIVVNPGSVGLPAYHDDLPKPHKMESDSPHAKYAILKKFSGQWSIELINVPYNWEKAAECAAINGRDDWGKSLLSGRS
jgi:putative phosphoesterase